ncbi:F-box and JmjC domain-containing protein [Aureobasidium pullulans]|uniref:F-box and JmjC domain-containing protein n=1 Tax=Aureobasidium pullulans TaxID=5580 RepID=A0A4S9RLX0_AURPU|nr:F-box and JmjC domain-containing protein [Aureobasidium pullulans]THY99469.1 F-box and JmjC domain-containing protein [Aureobasidium pullulans]
MTPPAALLDQEFEHPSRPFKKQKLDADSDHTTNPEESATIWSHPLGIRPSGNAFTATANLKAAIGTFALLPDELLAQFLDYLDAQDLLRLGGTCRALHAFSRSEELWKALFIESQPENFDWRGTWRSTVLSQPRSQEPDVDCSNLFSDALHRPYFCAHVSLDPYVTNIPARNQIHRLTSLTFEEFTESFTNKPFIISEPTKRWPVFGSWSVKSLLKQYSQVKFRAEAVDWPFDVYVDYMKDNHDESPLYLFDRSFAEKMNIQVADSATAHLYDGTSPDLSATQDGRKVAYWAPSFFGPDLFSVLGSQRPDHRWLIIGPSRSGSTFHKDPNATCAWNAVLTGRKYWIMFPSSSSLPPPPGVFVSADQSEVTSPLSIAEWFLGFHAEARRTEGCIEGICEAGELLYVPAGWYHLVVNLEDSIALTQNFVPRQRLASVLHFLRDKSDQVSGFSKDVQNPYELFLQKLKEQELEALEEALPKLEKMSKGPKGKWAEITKTTEDASTEGGFSFGFGGDDDEEVP